MARSRSAWPHSLRFFSITVISNPTSDQAPLHAFTAGHRALRPCSCPPLSRTGHSITGSATLWLLTATVFAVNGAVGAIVEKLHTAHSPHLKAQAATRFGTVLPFLRNPLRLCAVLKVAHSADGFGFLSDITVSPMNHLGIALLSTSIFGVLKTSGTRLGTRRPALQCPLVRVLLNNVVVVDRH